MMGMVLASPLAATHPEAAAGFLFGSVMPDLDALSRVFGKRAFLHSHQTFSHSVFTALAMGVVVYGILKGVGWEAPYAPVALATGMILHGLLDLSNTFGITIAAPFTFRRVSVEWVFFIDSVVLALTVPALVYVGWTWHAESLVPWEPVALYAACLFLYFAVKAALRWRAGRLAPKGTLSLVPSAFLPWMYLGNVDEGDRARLFRLNVLSGRISGDEHIPVFDEKWRALLDTVPEYGAMRELSPAYHVVEEKEGAETTALVLKDLRTRNFGGGFGRIDLVVSRDGKILEKTFHA
jgi:membrane-bound metal-dependent hydrolase YbcI (DUF457 family)